MVPRDLSWRQVLRGERKKCSPIIAANEPISEGSIVYVWIASNSPIMQTIPCVAKLFFHSNFPIFFSRFIFREGKINKINIFTSLTIRWWSELFPKGFLDYLFLYFTLFTNADNEFWSKVNAKNVVKAEGWKWK